MGFKKNVFVTKGLDMLTCLYTAFNDSIVLLWGMRQQVRATNKGNKIFS